MTDDHLIDAIYEAAVVTDAWPMLLDQLAVASGAQGGLLVSSRQDGVSWVTSPAIEGHYRGFVAGGWHERNDRIPRLVARRHAGFLTDGDVYSEQEIRSDPMYTDYLTPLGFETAAATVMPGLADDGLILSVEGFAAPETARAAIPALDRLRPHLARAGMLAARIGLERVLAAVATLDALSAPAAILGYGRRMMAANALFESHLRDQYHDTPSGLRLADARADARLGALLSGLNDRTIGCGGSVPVASAEGRRGVVIHVVPLRRAARDIFTSASAILLVAIPGNRAAPGVELIAALLDLTPAEARLAHALATGQSLAQAARAMGTMPSTARTHLKRIFAKTGMSRQSDLLSLLASVAPPEG